ncbi:MAG: hypothetical protein Q9213_004015 [Squamulea squamosa]
MSPQLNEAISLADNIESLIGSSQTIISLQDDSLRRRLRDAGRKLSLAMEAPTDTIHRIAYALGLARVGVDVRLFEILSHNDSPAFTNGELAHKTSVDAVLMSKAGL